MHTWSHRGRASSWRIRGLRKRVWKRTMLPSRSVSLCLETNHGPVASTSGEEYFSDASEGRRHSDSLSVSGRSSPVPRTRVEKVDHDPSYGEVPGTAAYDKRGEDAVPDEIEVLPEGSRSRSHSRADLTDGRGSRESTPVPLTLVEKVDPNTPSHGEAPGTCAYEQRRADAVPDLILKGGETGSKPTSPSPLERVPSEANSATTAVPETLLSRVDSAPGQETEYGPRAHRRQPSDSLPDSTERVQEGQSKHIFFYFLPMTTWQAKRISGND